MYIPDTETLRDLFMSAFHAAIQAGKQVLDVMDSDDYQISMKSDNSPISLADRMAHKTIGDFLMHTRIPVLSEEGRDIQFEERCSWDVLWIVDPLDGTRQFIKKRKEFTINIALISSGAPVLGVIYAPAYGVIYSGHKDKGSYKMSVENLDEVMQYSYNEIYAKSVKMPSSSDKKPQAYTILASLNHTNRETTYFIEEMKAKHGEVVVEKMGSSLKMCLLADGLADVYARHTDTYEWDTAAAQVVLEGAGYTIKDIETGQPLVYNKESLTNPYFICERNQSRRK
jgi:3'(2'), 5'-bisphosphate nucleotidase